MLLDYRRLFDGTAFHGPGRLEITGGLISRVGLPTGPEPADESCAFVMPGLVDAHAAVYGYQERPPDDDPFAPHRAALALHLRMGVTTIRDPGNSLEALAYLRSLDGARLVAAGPVLDGLPLSRPASHLVRHAGDVKNTVAALVLKEVQFLSLGRYLPADLAEAAISAGHAAGLPVALEAGRTDVATGCRAGVNSIEYLPGLTGPAASPLERVLAWANPGDGAVRALEALAAGPTALVPLVTAQRRRVILKEAINEPGLDDAVPIMPYHKHLKTMRGSVGYAIGRRFLDEHMSFPALNRAELAEVERAFESIGAWLCAAHRAGVPILVGSGSPGVAAIAGHGMWREIQTLRALGLPADAVLAGATARAADLAGRPDLGRVTPGAVADLLLVEHEPDDDLLSLSTSTRRVLHNGTILEPP